MSKKQSRGGHAGHDGDKTTSETAPAPAVPVATRAPARSVRFDTVAPEEYDPRVMETKLPKLRKPAAEPRRSGRPIRMPLYEEEYLMGSELDDAAELNSIGKSSDDVPSSPPGQFGKYEVEVLQLERKRKSGGKDKASFVNNNEEASSDTIAPWSPKRLKESNAFLSTIEPAVYQVMDSLRDSLEIYVDLPNLSNAARPGTDLPYSAKFLTHLYLLCYDKELWHLCDLVADTWIRAFHELRKQGQTSRPNAVLWRPNAALEKRTQEVYKEMRKLKYTAPEKLEKMPSGVGWDSKAPNLELSVEDPPLVADVTDFNPDLLKVLYQNTAKTCGARFLWADAMALGGQKLETLIERWSKRDEELHPDLLFNIMQSSLRMVRRKLTLKIEESTEGAWCNRYHEHVKHDMSCYRTLAWFKAQEDANSTSSEEDDEDEDDETGADTSTKAKRLNSKKRSHEEDEDEDDAMHAAKRRWGQDGIDEDDSDDDDDSSSSSDEE